MLWLLKVDRSFHKGGKVEKQHTILLAEDHWALQQAVKDLLSAEGYRVLAATDGAEALDLMHETRPDLIIADVMMPRMDGYELYEKVREKPEWVTIPFIFLTARAEPEDIIKGKGLGAEDYITKPFNPDELLAVVKARLERAEAIQEVAEAEFDRLRRQIVNILSHELRTPLTYIRGYTDLALEDLHGLPPEALQDFLLGIQRGTQRLSRLIEDLLLMVQLESGRLKEELKANCHVVEDPTPLIQKAMSLYEERAHQQQSALILRAEPPYTPVAVCDVYFMDALSRLLDNALKFSNGTQQPVVITVESKPSWLEIAVTDYGVGIPAAEIPNLFQKFRQIERERYEQQGVGIGLYIARQLILLHDGDIEVESQPGEGSTFTIRLPAAAGRE